ncbi:MAG: ATP-binding protein [Eubacteriaceae bacterium]|nr:ATP-binding protein [Eubacteriaceae bacterium]MDD4507510.1 ATP-binding protein [Eubacteriaceae bacterium]
MHRLTSQLIVYRNIDSDSILFKLSDICRRYTEGEYMKEALISEIYVQINRLLDVATRYGFNTNLWHNYLAFLLAVTENPFTLVSEKNGAQAGTVNDFAKNDFAVFKRLFDYDFSDIEKGLGIHCFSTIESYRAIMKSEQIFNKSVSEKVQELSQAIETAQGDDALYQCVTDFYKTYGVGKLGLNRAFRIGNEANISILEPITATGNARLDDLVGYDIQKQKLIENTEAFVAGRRANNVLLYGDAGTGKSTSIKAILNEYESRGLRMIEVYKHEFKYLSRVISEIKNRNYRFIIYMDDLSFEEFEIEYKYLKAVIEGGLETKPENVLIYATSNRRHLIRETWSDRNDGGSDEVHMSDTVQEKLSLSDRFGVTIGYFRPSPDEFYNIVIGLARQYPEITLSDEALKDEAMKWEMRHSGMSGRTAQQFINHLLGSSLQK